MSIRFVTFFLPFTFLSNVSFATKCEKVETISSQKQSNAILKNVEKIWGKIPIRIDTHGRLMIPRGKVYYKYWRSRAPFEIPDTAFALHFLKKSQLAEWLTFKAREALDIAKDSGEVTLNRQTISNNYIVDGKIKSIEGFWDLKHIMPEPSSTGYKWYLSRQSIITAKIDGELKTFLFDSNVHNHLSASSLLVEKVETFSESTVEIVGAGYLTVNNNRSQKKSGELGDFYLGEVEFRIAGGNSELKIEIENQAASVFRSMDHDGGFLLNKTEFGVFGFNGRPIFSGKKQKLEKWMKDLQ